MARAQYYQAGYTPPAGVNSATGVKEYQELAVWGIQVFTMMIIPLSFQYVFVDALTALGMTKISLSLSLLPRGRREGPRHLPAHPGQGLQEDRLFAGSQVIGEGSAP